jgi:hypothetical protein
MDQQDEKRTAAADAGTAEAAQKREEAIRKVEEMLAQNRRNIDQGEINTSSSKSWASALKRMNMTAPRDPGMELLEEYKPEKPLAEMAPDEAEAERKKAEAIARVAAMMQQQQADDERRYHNIDGKRSRRMFQFRRPQEKENSVDIASILSGYRLSPEAQERYEKIRFGIGKGTVRPPLSARLGCIALPILSLFSAYVLGLYQNMAVMKPWFIILALLFVPVAYYVNTWTLEFDSESGIVKYHSLFHGNNLYEMKELTAFEVSQTPDKPFPFSLPGLLDPRSFLVIRTMDHTINIPLKYTNETFGILTELDGYESAGDLQRCLEQQRRELYRLQASEPSAPVQKSPAVTEMPALPEKPAEPEKPAPVQAKNSAPVQASPAVQEMPVLLEKPAEPEKPAPVQAKPSAPDRKPAKPAAEKPKPAPEPKPVPKPDPVDLAKAREMFAQPAPSVLSMPERGSAFPDPTKSAFPDPTQKPKTDVDVDALFNQVLREHGKLK